MRKLATLKQFALLIDVNPFVTGYGNREKVKTTLKPQKQMCATDSQSVAHMFNDKNKFGLGQQPEGAITLSFQFIDSPPSHSTTHPRLDKSQVQLKIRYLDTNHLIAHITNIKSKGLMTTLLQLASEFLRRCEAADIHLAVDA